MELKQKNESESTHNRIQEEKEESQEKSRTGKMKTLAENGSLFCVKQMFKSDHPDSNTKACHKGRQNYCQLVF